jgi:hypothetical protein
MKNRSTPTATHYTGFQTCLEGAAHESRLRARRIFIKDTKKVADVIMKPSEYIKYIESLRAQIRR